MQRRVRDRIKELKRVRAGDLEAHKDNWRRHTGRQAGALRSILEEVGWADALIAREREDGRLELIDGHLRAELDPDQMVPVLILDVDEAEARKLLAVMDPIAGLAEVDLQALGDLSERVDFGSPELDQLIAGLLTGEKPSSDAGVDEAPKLPDEPVTQPGDVWIMGDHRLVCGDALDPKCYRAVLGTSKADMAFIDPPYNMDYRSKGLGGIANDDLDDRSFARLVLGGCYQLRTNLRSGGSYYICMSAAEYPLLCAELRKLGMSGRVIVWAKPCAGLGAQEYRPRFEIIIYGWLGPRRDRVWNGERRESDLWEFDLDRSAIARLDDDGNTIVEVGFGLESIEVALEGEVAGTVSHADGSTDDLWRFARESGPYVHPTQKPVALIERAIRNSSDPGDLVLDSFAGSGSTLIACERLGRRFTGIELDPRYCDVSVERWEAVTGKAGDRRPGR